LGSTTRGDADLFVGDRSDRIASEPVQITTDGFGSYTANSTIFEHRADHGSEVKDYGLLDDDAPEQKYSPMVVKRVVRTPIYGIPDPNHITTAHVERNNLTMRMSMRRFTRLTNG